mgnify:FL=1
MTECEIPFIIILTKADKLKKTARKNRVTEIQKELADFDGVKLITFSSETGEGVEGLREILDSVTQND